MRRLELARQVAKSREYTCDKCDVALVATSATEVNDWVAVAMRCPRCATLYTVRITVEDMLRFFKDNS